MFLTLFPGDAAHGSPNHTNYWVDVTFTQTPPQGQVNYVWDVAGGLLPQDGTKTYVYGDRLLYTVTGTGTGTPTWLFSDKIGSTATLMNAAGVVTGTYTYDVFGAVKTQTGAATEFSFTGEQKDPNELTFLRARYYDASTGRFLSKDPFPGSARRPASLNRYTYVGNNPVNSVDPSGKCICIPSPGLPDVVGLVVHTGGVIVGAGSSGAQGAWGFTTETASVAWASLSSEASAWWAAQNDGGNFIADGVTTLASDGAALLEEGADNFEANAPDVVSGMVLVTEGVLLYVAIDIAVDVSGGALVLAFLETGNPVYLAAAAAAAAQGQIYQNEAQEIIEAGLEQMLGLDE